MVLSVLQNGDVRLININDSTYMTGRLEIYYHDRWGTVCDDYFDSSVAMVVCRQLGLNPVGAMAVFRAGYGQGSDPVWLDYISCTGAEENITSCSHSLFGSFYCSHSEDAGVICPCKF